MSRFFVLRFLIFFLLFFHNMACSSQELKIGIVGAYNPEYDHIGKYAHLNKLAYAKKHGYEIYLHTDYLQPIENILWWPTDVASWQGYWYKVLAIQKHLSDCDWLFYLDSDGLIMNDSIRLESLIDDNYDFIISPADEGRTPISSQFLIKNSDWSREFLRCWLAIGNTHIQPGFDNGALIKLFSEYPGIHEHVKMIPREKLGSYLWDYKDGDFAIQFAGYTHEKKRQLMQTFYENSHLNIAELISVFGRS